MAGQDIHGEGGNSKITEDPSEDDQNPEVNVAEEYEFLDSKLDELNSALDFLEQKNDDIHEKLKQLLQSNIDIRQQMQNDNNTVAENN